MAISSPGNCYAPHYFLYLMSSGLIKHAITRLCLCPLKLQHNGKQNSELIFHRACDSNCLFKLLGDSQLVHVGSGNCVKQHNKYSGPYEMSKLVISTECTIEVALRFTFLGKCRFFNRLFVNKN